jgi:uncharacterized membrane protein
MNRYPDLLGPMMRHGEVFGNGNPHETGTSSVEWAILGLTIAIFVCVLLLLADRCRYRRHHRLGWIHSGGFDKPLAIVRMRYSRGEMSREEYLQALEDLGASPEQKTAPAPTPAPEGGTPPRRRGRR